MGYGSFQKSGLLIPASRKSGLQGKDYRNSEQQMQEKNWNVLGLERDMLWLEIGCEQMKEKRRVYTDGLGGESCEVLSVPCTLCRPFDGSLHLLLLHSTRSSPLCCGPQMTEAPSFH